MERRRFVSGVGVAATSLVAGCLADAIGPADRTSRDGEPSTDESADTPTVRAEEPRIDEPPYEVEEPERADDSGSEAGANAHYLGERMPEEPSLEFDAFPDVRLESSALDGDDGYGVRLIEDADELASTVDLERVPDDARARLEGDSFAEEVAVVVESGYGSSSVRHAFGRVEAVEDGVHVHGYYTQPSMRTDDRAARSSIVIVERPDDLEVAHLSLTVAADRRVHCNSTEGPVSPDG